MGEAIGRCSFGGEDERDTKGDDGAGGEGGGLCICTPLGMSCGAAWIGGSAAGVCSRIEEEGGA